MVIIAQFMYFIALYVIVIITIFPCCKIRFYIYFSDQTKHLLNLIFYRKLKILAKLKLYKLVTQILI